MARFFLFLSAALAATALTACGGGDDPAVSEEDRRQGAEVHPRLLAEFGGAYREEEAAYLARLGERIAAAAGLGGRCTFTLVNSDVVNAFAVPGCYIYVTRGLMAIVGSEAELASVLAHEVGHIVGRHSQRQQRRSMWRGLGVLAVEFVTGSERLTRIAGAAAALFTLRYSRGQEYEADDLGVSYLRAAGYDPHAAADMLAALGRHERFLARTRGRDEARSIPEWVRTHPLTESRIARAGETAAATGIAADALPENEAGYLREVDRLLWGDDPAQGFVIGRRFAHPQMRIGFEAPPGFTLTNSPQAILIEGPDGLRGEFAGGRLPPGGLEDYVAALLTALFGKRPVAMGAARRLEVNGLAALFVPVAVETPDGTASLSIAAYAGEGGAAYHFAMVSSPEAAAGAAPGAGPGAAVEALFRSFRQLAPEEARALRPRRIAVVRAAAGDSVQSLSARMAAEHPAELFLMLNGRTAAQPIRPGEPVKLVLWSAR